MPASRSQFSGFTVRPWWNSRATTVTSTETPKAESRPVAPKGQDSQIIAWPHSSRTGNWMS